MHTFTKIFSLAVLVSLIILQGCENERPTEPHTDPIDFYPLATGNTWIGQLDGLTVGGHNDSSTVSGRINRRIIGQTTHSQGFAMWTMERADSLVFWSHDTLYTFIDTTYVYFFVNDSEIVVYDDTISIEHEILFKLPLTVGETWTPFTGDPTVTREVVSLNDSIIVPAGSFTECLLTRDIDSMSPKVWNYYFAPDIGRAFMTVDSGPNSHASERLMNVVIN